MERIIAIQLEISNTVNDDLSYEWFFPPNDEVKETWKNSRKREEQAWNNDKSVRSTRYYSFQEFTKDSLLECDVTQLKGLSLKQFIKLLGF
jgi:hypothetical protein